MKTYLGDGVYVEIENGAIKLTVEDGVSVSNTIFLELKVYAALVGFITRRSKGKE